MNVKEIRRENLRLLANDIGGVAEVARRLKKSTSQISHLIGPNPIKNIGDRIAAQVENLFDKPAGWLDHPHVGNDDVLHDNQQNITNTIPMISWQQAWDWPDINQSLQPHQQLTIFETTASAHSFALTLYNDVMEANHGISFPAGCYIIVDPTQKIAANNFVLVKDPRQQQVIFRQLVSDGNRQYLKPLNQRYPITAVPNDAEIIGVIVQMRLDIL